MLRNERERVSLLDSYEMEKKEMDFDDMLVELGELGKFQITTYILVCIPVFFAAANSLSYVFTAGIPNYRCLVPGCDNPETAQYEADFTQWALPGSASSGQILDAKANICNMYKINRTISNFTCAKDQFSQEIMRCNEFVFDHTERTIVNDWNLTCPENQWKLSFVGTTHFAGIVVGSAFFGILADTYGRKNIFIFCIILMSISGVGQAISPEYITFDIMMFINAMGTAGVYPLAFIIGVEMVGKKKREITGIVLNYFYALGEAVVAPIAWYFREWTYVQIIVSAPAILFVGYYWIIPESVRWLLANRKRTKAKKIVCQVAKFNKVTLSEGLLDSFNDTAPLQRPNEKPTDTSKPNTIKNVLKIIFKSKKLLIRFAIIYFIWAVNAFVFYGLSVNSTSIGGNKYLNFALVSLIEIPGYTLAWVCIQKLGRKLSLVGSLLLCGLTCTLTVFVPEGMSWAIILLFLIGKLGITSSFGVVYVHTAEMLPTVVRSGGVGSASTVARMGALLAPFVPVLGVYFAALPMLLFGGLAVTAGLLALRLPETLGTKLPETIEEAESL